MENVVGMKGARDEGKNEKRMRKEVEEPDPIQRRRRLIVPIDVRKKEYHGNIWKYAPDDDRLICISLLEDPRQNYTKKHVLHPQHFLYHAVST